MISDKLKRLREEKKYSQSPLARILNVTRSSVNAWELGISVPSTQYIVKLAQLYKVSSDYLLGIDETATISVEGLSEKETTAVVESVNCLKQRSEERCFGCLVS